MMVAISLTNSERVAYVSDEDSDLAQYAWFLKRSHTGEYVCRSVRDGTRIKTVRLHRVVVQRMLGDIPLPCDQDIHHGPDTDTMNNTRENLTPLEHVHHAHAFAKRS